MNKKIIIFIIGITLIILLFPIRNILKDGGTKTYKSIIYKITKYHELNNDYKEEYKTGIRIELLGFKIYEKITSEKKTTYELIIYEMEDGRPHNPNTYCCKTDKIYRKIKVETNNAKVLDISKNDNYILISDGKVKMYNTITKELTTINLEANYKAYIIQTTEDNKLIGITYYKTKENDLYNNAGFYNIITNKKLYDGTYSVINIKDENTLEAMNKENTKIYTLNINEEKIIKEENITTN